jgi:hypothetical protein
MHIRPVFCGAFFLGVTAHQHPTQIKSMARSGYTLFIFLACSKRITAAIPNASIGLKPTTNYNEQKNPPPRLRRTRKRIHHRRPTHRQTVIAVDSYENAPAMQVAHGFEVINMLDGDALDHIVAKHQPDFIVPEIEAIRTERFYDYEKQGITVVPSAKAANFTMNRKPSAT